MEAIIYFGQVILVDNVGARGNRVNKKYVVIKTEPAGITGGVLLRKPQGLAIGSPDGITPDNIAAVTPEIWTLEQVLAALVVFQGFPLDRIQENQITEYSHNPVFVLKR